MVAFSVGLSLPAMYLVAQWIRQTYRNARQSYGDLRALLATNVFLSSLHAGISIFQLVFAADIDSGQRFRSNLLHDSVREITKILYERVPRAPTMVASRADAAAAGRAD